MTVTMRKTSRLAGITELIDQILIGEAATSVADDTVTTFAVHTVAILPTWTWLLPKITIGGKTGTSEMPVRVDWDGGPLLVLDAEETRYLSWHQIGMGHEARGVATIKVDSSGAATISGTPDAFPAIDFRDIPSPRAFKVLRRKLASAGTDARWQLMQSIEWWARAKLDDANKVVSQDVAELEKRGYVRQVIDPVGLDTLVSKMLVGDDGADDSTISRLVERCLQPDQFQKVDPLHYITVSIRARAEEAVRSAIGDPHTGRKIRRIQEMTKAGSLDELVTAYREHYPKDRLARNRASAALTIGAMAEASADPIALQFEPAFFQSGFVFEPHCQRSQEATAAIDVAFDDEIARRRGDAA